jgi:hypothetical protein
MYKQGAKASLSHLIVFRQRKEWIHGGKGGVGEDLVNIRRFQTRNVR